MNKIITPEIDENIIEYVENSRKETNHDYKTILLFGMVDDYSPEVRIYAGYKYLEENKTDGPAWLELAQAHIENNDFKQAENILKYLDLEENNGFGLYKMLYGEDPKVHYTYLLLKKGDLEEALKQTKSYQEKHKDYAVNVYIQATILHEMENFDKAKKLYQNAINILKQNIEDYEGENELETINGVIEYIKTQEKKAENKEKFDAKRPLEIWDLYEDDMYAQDV